MGFRISIGNKFYTVRYVGGLSRVYDGNPDKGARELCFFKRTQDAIEWAKKELKNEILNPKKKKKKKH